MTSRPHPAAADRVVLGEASVTKVVAVYRARGDAEAALRRLRDAALAGALLEPADAGPGRRDGLARKLEPESRGIFHTIVRAHLATGAIGLAVGLVIWGVLRSSGQPMVASSPTLSLIFIAFLTTTLGLLVGGLIALRPDHAKVITELRVSLQAGAYAVVAHPLDGAGADRAEHILRDGSERVDRTL